MNKKLLLTAALTAAALSGCASQPVTTFDTFHANSLNDLVRSGELVQKTNSFFIINDSSSSMSKHYHGAGFTGQPTPTKFSVEKEILNRMNQSIPDINLTSGIRSFGFGPCLSWGFTHLNQPVETYSKSSFGQGIDSLTCSGGGSLMSNAITAASTDLSPATGNIALIILSDGNIDDGSQPLIATQSLKEQFGDKLCVYTVWVGNEDDSQGQILLRKLSDISGCGFSTTAENVASNNDMTSFVQHVFLQPGAPRVVDGDDDQDGVLNSKDRCPRTPRTATVDIHGCWAVKGIRFDIDKATIKPQYLPLLDNAISVLKNNPSLQVEVQGHTDNTGSAAYNQKLSERRAKAVRDYLVSKTGKAEALTSRGYGLTRPIDTNSTSEGRYNNRRVQLKILNGRYN
ncbi:MAG: flagellar motor protein MotB [Gammaproteobacteria bacterium HGW-Gammaproteobacteria-3]|nr:MAG: flagellar motor protein MotB [Gammaproteobacteria bacterium HGW-Gammaproteobacteria-3]